MTLRCTALISIFFLMIAAAAVSAQNIHELRKYTEDDWIAMSTEERLNALGMAVKQSYNQTFVGDFGIHYDAYKKWGYEFYEMEDRYENYAFRGFENYNVIEERRRKWSYNEFGDRITKLNSYGNIWREVYRGDGRFALEMPNRYINSMTTGDVDGVWVAGEATNDWALSAIGAGAIRTKFSPLTLSLPNMHGARVDFQSDTIDAAFVTSSLLSSVEHNMRGENIWNSLPTQGGGVLLRGGYIRRKFGALSIGASYVNEYGVQGNREGGDDWYGTVSNYTPTPIVVAIRFLDDSPSDNEGGPAIYDVRLKVNGKYRYDIIPDVIMDDITRDRVTAVSDRVELEYLDPPTIISAGNTQNDFLNIYNTLPKYLDYFYLKESIQGKNINKVQQRFDLDLAGKYYTLKNPSEVPIRVDGSETCVYWFDLGSIKHHVNRIEAEVTVANDYRIQTALIYTKKAQGGHDTKGDSMNHYDATYWKTMAQQEGNVKDSSNLTTLSIDFGVQVASIVYGLDMHFNYHGFHINGEYVVNSSHYMFPDDLPGTGMPSYVVDIQPPRQGHKWSERDHAYYITAKKDWRTFGFAGEVFKMGRFYRPYMDYYFPRVDAGAVNARNSTVRLPLIEDNDDDDMYPDTMVEMRTMGKSILSIEDPDGVFPGNDSDNDGVPDNNKNNNAIPDYNEPFLMFDSDPDEFVFGNDYNNNTIPDFREDDMKLDTPYDLDRQGHHLIIKYSPFPHANIILGTFRTQGVGLSNRTNDDYFRVQVDYNVFDIGKIFTEYRHERIQDDIRDQYMKVSTKFKENFVEKGFDATYGRFSRELYHDELEYKNSRVNRLFVDSKIRAIPSITIENQVKYEQNDQLEGLLYDKTYQPAETINTLAIVNKIGYSKRYGNWTLSPGIKFRLYKKDRSDRVRLGEFPGMYYTMRIPLVILKYDISTRTDFSVGMQGLPGLPFNYKNYVQSENDFDRNTYILQLQNETTYFGYNVWANTGIKIDRQKFIESRRAFENYKSSTVFVNILLGWN